MRLNGKNILHRLGIGVEIYKGIRKTGLNSLLYQCYLTNLVEQQQIDLILDVGGNKGHFGDQMRRGGYKGSIISFEPNPDVAARLTKRVASPTSNWSVVQAGISDEATELVLNVLAGDDLSSFLPPSKQSIDNLGSATDLKHKVNAPVFRLDNLPCDQFAQQCETIDSATRIFLKTDTQGFDVKVLHGASALLDKVVLMQCEADFEPNYDDAPTALELMQLAESLEFELMRLQPITTTSDGLALACGDLIYGKRKLMRAL